MKTRQAGAARPWRAQEKTPDGQTIEYTGTGLFDELLIEGFLHLEWLDGESWYVRVGDARITATMLPDGRVEVDVQRGVYSEVCGETTTWNPSL